MALEPESWLATLDTLHEIVEFEIDMARQERSPLLADMVKALADAYDVGVALAERHVEAGPVMVQANKIRRMEHGEHGMCPACQLVMRAIDDYAMGRADRLPDLSGVSIEPH